MMRQILIIIYILVITGPLLGGCASVQEKRALSDWRMENPKWAGNNAGDLPLPDLNEKATLDDYILYALLNNPGLRSAFERWKAALENVTSARMLPDPLFTYANYIKEVETRVGPQRHRFGLAQTFPWLGKLKLRGEAALQTAHAERERYEATKLKLIYQVKSTYYEYYYLSRAGTITRDNVTLLKHLERVARTKYKSGAGLQSAVIRAQVELGKLEDRWLSLQDLMQPIAARLNSLLNRPLHLPLPVPTGLFENIDTSIGKINIDDILLQKLNKDNPELKIFDFMSARENYVAKLSSKDIFPDLTLGVDYIETGERTDMELDENGTDPVIAKLSVNLPIWHHKYTAYSDAAQARRLSLVHDKKEKENLLIADLQMALYRLRDASRKIDLYGNTLLPKATQTLKVTQSAFTSDKASFLDLIDAQRILLDFQLEHERALADRFQRLAEIEMITAGSIER